jgi:hypothetical protein
MLAEEIGPLSELDRQFCEVISLTDLGRFTRPYEGCGNGAPPHARVLLVHAFVAKSVYQFPTTAALVDALCSHPHSAFDGFTPAEFPAKIAWTPMGAPRGLIRPVLAPDSSIRPKRVRSSPFDPPVSGAGQILTQPCSISVFLPPRTDQECQSGVPLLQIPDTEWTITKLIGNSEEHSTANRFPRSEAPDCGNTDLPQRYV